MHFKITHSSTGQQPDKFSADLNCRPYFGRCCRYVWLFYYLSSQRRRASSDHRLLGDDKCSFPLSVNATPKVMYTSGMVFLLYSFFSFFFFLYFSDYDLRKGNRFGYRFYFEEVYHLRLGQINSSVDYLQNLI